MNIFLIAGKAGSGKNEVASIIKSYLPNTVVTGFSKYIKLFALELTSWDGRDFNKPRTYLQNMGDTLRKIDNDFLTKRVLEDINVYETCGINNVVVSDVRLINELNFFKNTNYNVITIKINSSESKRELSKKEKMHHTELELDGYKEYDYVINNNYNEDLKNDVIKILEGMK